LTALTRRSGHRVRGGERLDTRHRKPVQACRASGVRWWSRRARAGCWSRRSCVVGPPRRNRGTMWHIVVRSAHVGPLHAPPSPRDTSTTHPTRASHWAA
jgi:hypothetical protein